MRPQLRLLFSYRILSWKDFHVGIRRQTQFWDCIHVGLYLRCRAFPDNIKVDFALIKTMMYVIITRLYSENYSTNFWEISLDRIREFKSQRQRQR